MFSQIHPNPNPGDQQFTQIPIAKSSPVFTMAPCTSSGCALEAWSLCSSARRSATYQSSNFYVCRNDGSEKWMVLWWYIKDSENNKQCLSLRFVVHRIQPVSNSHEDSLHKMDSRATSSVASWLAELVGLTANRQCVSPWNSASHSPFFKGQTLSGAATVPCAPKTEWPR